MGNARTGEVQEGLFQFHPGSGLPRVRVMEIAEEAQALGPWALESCAPGPGLPAPHSQREGTRGARGGRWQLMGESWAGPVGSGGHVRVLPGTRDGETQRSALLGTVCVEGRVTCRNEVPASSQVLTWQDLGQKRFRNVH